VEVSSQIRAARVRSIYERLTATSLITVVNGALMVAVLERRVVSLWPWLWLALVVALATARIASGRSWRRDPQPFERLRRWEVIAVAGSLLSGALWGVGSVGLFPADGTGQWLWIFLIAGMCAGAATLHAAHAPTALAYILPASLPLALRLALVGRAEQSAAAAMIVVFLIGITFTVLRFSRQFDQVFTLQLDLEQRTLDLDKANARLRAEIEDHRSTEATLRQAQKMEALGQITGGIAHDFNNLLTVITGNLDLIRRRAPDSEAIQRLAAAASHAAKRGADLTGSLLSFARKQALRPETVDVNALVRDFAQLLRRAAGETVVLELDLGADPAASYADAAHFQSAVLNLVINARDAMPSGGRVLISTRNATLDGETRAVVVRVQDSGTGMSPEVAARAFEPFFTTKEVGKGSGLGLSQVYGFARQSGGYARIESAPSEGTSVSLVLPALVVSLPAEGDDVVRAKLVAAEAGPVRVLLVEDDLEVLSTLREQMLMPGWSVVPARNGPMALALLSADPEITVLVTDVMMPGGMSGVELARLAARARDGLPTLLISGYPSAALEEAGADVREFELLHKPFSQQELIEHVLAAIAAQRVLAAQARALG
jgi:signal transduction histidine kinase/ActR/RegA family two-component response regulator